MLKRSTITVATIAACGVVFAFGASVVVQPRLVHPISAAAPSVEGKPHPAGSGRVIPHKFMRSTPRTT
jgi:hypothetical protein